MKGGHTTKTMKYIELLLSIFLAVFLIEGLWLSVQGLGNKAVIFFLLSGVLWLVKMPIKNRDK